MTSQRSSIAQGGRPGAGATQRPGASAAQRQGQGGQATRDQLRGRTPSSTTGRPGAGTGQRPGAGDRIAQGGGGQGQQGQRQAGREQRQSNRGENQTQRQGGRSDRQAGRGENQAQRQGGRSDRQAGRGQNRDQRQAGRGDRFNGDRRQNNWNNNNNRYNNWTSNNYNGAWGGGYGNWGHNNWWGPAAWTGVSSFLGGMAGAAIAGSWNSGGGASYYSQPSEVIYSSEGGGSYAGGDTIIVNGTAEPTVQYAEEATQIADNYGQLSSEVATPPAAGAEVSPEEKAAITEDWMPLGVYGLTDENSTAEPTQYVQLLISKSGAIGGELHDLTADTSTPLYGAVDPKTQRAAWKVGNTDTVMETGLYNLTESETPLLVHQGAQKTQQMMMARIEDPNASQSQPVETSQPEAAPH
jgi:hypothetical protein